LKNEALFLAFLAINAILTGGVKRLGASTERFDRRRRRSTVGRRACRKKFWRI
jgi:hypothetical protein